MPKGVPNKRYTGEFKQEVVAMMQREKLSHKEVARLYGITAHDRVASWERIYLEEGPEGLYIACQSRGSKGRPPKKRKPEVEVDSTPQAVGSSDVEEQNGRSRCYHFDKRVGEDDP